MFLSILYCLNELNLTPVSFVPNIWKNWVYNARIWPVKITFWIYTFATEAFMEVNLCVIVEEIQDIFDPSTSIILSGVMFYSVLINWNLKQNCSSFDISGVILLWTLNISVASVWKFSWNIETYLCLFINFCIINNFYYKQNKRFFFCQGFFIGLLWFEHSISYLVSISPVGSSTA